MTIKKIEIQDDQGNIYYPHTNANVVNCDDGQSVATHLADISSQVSGKGASLIGLNDASGKITATNVEGAILELFTNANDGKTAVASAITAKGVTASSADTFPTLATKVGQIAKGQGNAVESKVLSGSTFSNLDGVLRTGNIPIRGSEEFPAWRRAVVDIMPPSSGRAHFSIPLGAYVTPNSQQSNNMGIFVDDATFTPSNIISGKSIFGLAGTAIAFPTTGLISGGNTYWGEFSGYTYTTDGTSYIKAFEKAAHFSGTVKLSWVISKPYGYGSSGIYVYSQIWVNGVARSRDFYSSFTSSGDYQAQDLYENVVVNYGDLVQIYTKGKLSSGYYFGLTNINFSVGNTWLS